MNSRSKIARMLIYLGVILFQLIMTQLVTLIASLLFPQLGNLHQTNSALFAIILGLTFASGVFLAGWLALRLRWLKYQPQYRARLAGSLIGAYLPLGMALVIYKTLEAGNPFFFISILGSIVGFHLLGWGKRK